MSHARVVLCSVLLCACEGQIAAPGQVATGGGVFPPGDVPPPRTSDPLPLPPTDPCENAAVDPGTSPIRRLNRTEYDNTVRDLLGDTTHPSSTFPPDEQLLGFDNNATALTLSPTLAEQYMNSAEALVAAAPLTTLVSCDPVALGESACATQAIQTFGKRAYRRPLTGTEVSRMLTLYNWARGQAQDFATSMRVVAQAMLQSPKFLYRVELGGSQVGQGLQISGYEMASRLSYFLWQSMPDDALFAAADQGELSTPAQIEAQARRMLSDPRARTTVANFHRQWLEQDNLDRAIKDPTLFPNFAALQPSMREESRRFVDDVFWSDGHAPALFTSTYTFADSALARFYGATAPSGSGFQKVNLDPTQRSGVLTQAGWLSTWAKPDRTSPIHRGKFVREQLLCMQLAAPPANVPPPPPLDPTKTQREQLMVHSQNASCNACHKLMDPVGFGFEGYDAIGAVRATENGLPVDTSGEVVQGGDATGTFNGAVELSQRLSKSTTVMGCVTTQWFRFAAGRADSIADACTQKRLVARFSAAGWDMKELLVALTQTDAFLYRDTRQGGTP
jgi:hypothetical protein